MKKGNINKDTLENLSGDNEIIYSQDYLIQASNENSDLHFDNTKKCKLYSSALFLMIALIFGYVNI